MSMTGRPEKFGVWLPESAEDKANGISPELRCFLNHDKPIQTVCKDGSKTAWEMFEMAAKAHGQKDCLGSRTLLKRDFVKSSDGKKTFEKVEMSNDYKFNSYQQTMDRVTKLAGGLVKETGMKTKDNVLIFAETQAGWLETALACWRQNVAVVTAYATLGAEGVTSAITQSKATTCLCDARLYDVLVKCKASCPTLKHVVVITTKVDKQVDEMQKEFGEEVKVHSLEQLIQAGSSNEVQPVAADPSDMAVLMYTSGTTGNAKGVITSHRSFVTAARSSTDFMPFLNRDTVMCCYLPLAHIMEMVVELCAIHVGGALGYGNPQTLTDTGVKLAKGQRGDAPLLKPTIMIFAPAVLDKVYNGVMDKIRGTGCKEKVFMAALASGKANYEAGGVGANCCYNKILAGSVQALVGGRVKNIVAGSAPLSAEIQQFAQTAFNAPARQGYGLTETAAASCVGHHTDNTLNQVGGPTPGTKIRLRDWPEGNYRNADETKEGVFMRRGEVLIGGPMVSEGYWIDESNPDSDVQAKNKEDWVTINGERYFCSGDIGAVTSMGQLKIVDRKKDLFKGAAGEYVSLSKVEALVKLSQYIEMPMAYGKTGAKNIMILAIPKKGAVDKFASENNLTIPSGGYAEIIKKDKFIQEVTKSVLEACKPLAGFEKPAAVGLCIAADGTPAWTPDNDNLTTTMKLKRPVIVRNFQAEIDEAYSRAK